MRGQWCKSGSTPKLYSRSCFDVYSNSLSKFEKRNWLSDCGYRFCSLYQMILRAGTSANATPSILIIGQLIDETAAITIRRQCVLWQATCQQLHRNEISLIYSLKNWKQPSSCVFVLLIWSRASHTQTRTHKHTEKIRSDFVSAYSSRRFFRFSGHCFNFLAKMLTLQQNYVAGFLYTGSTEVIRSLNKRVYFRKQQLLKSKWRLKRRS